MFVEQQFEEIGGGDFCRISENRETRVEMRGCGTTGAAGFLPKCDFICADAVNTVKYYSSDEPVRVKQHIGDE
jgi:hypothetical protein